MGADAGSIRNRRIVMLVDDSVSEYVDIVAQAAPHRVAYIEVETHKRWGSVPPPFEGPSSNFKVVSAADATVRVGGSSFIW